MSNSAVTVDLAPGYYLENQTINVTFNEAVESVAINKDGTPPSISKYIAYDTLNPPNPFISVTEDGAGRVVYDGGFPKLYDNKGTAGNVNDYHDRFRIHVTLTPEETQEDYSEVDPPVFIKILDASEIEKLGIGDGYLDISTTVGAHQLDGIQPALYYEYTLHSNPNGDTRMDRQNLSGTTVTPVDLGPLKNLYIGVFGTSTSTVDREFKLEILEMTITNRATKDKVVLFGSGANLHLDNRMDRIQKIRVPGDIDTRVYSSWDLLTPSMKYVMNAVEWVMDQSKVRANNRKVLFLGDSVGNYRIDLSGGNHFNTTIRNMIRHGRWTDSVIKVRTQYSGGYIDARYSELNQYAAVFIMGSQSGTTRWITQASVDDIIRYREDGGGLFLITDHGPILPTLQSAQTTTGTAFFHSTNQIANRFGAWFSGDYNRIPVNVGFLRQNYGEHPLYKNMLDSEDVYAGVSESRIFVTSDPVYPPGQVTKQYTTNDGYNVINIMCVMDDGSMIPVKLEYNIVDYTMIFMLDGHEVSSGQVFDAGTKDYITVSFKAIGTDVAMEGKLWIDEVVVGAVSKPLGGTPIFSPERTDRINVKDVIRINNNSVLSLRFSNPAGMETSSIIRRTIVSQSISIPLRYSEYGDLLRSLLPEPSAPSRLISNLDESDSYLRLPKAIDVSKAHMAGPYRSRLADFVVDVADFVVGNVSWRGFFLHRSDGGDGVITPDVMGGTAIRDMNASLPVPLELQVGFPKEEPTPLLPVAIYIDNIGPLYMSRSRIDDNGSLAAQRYFYTNGVSNIYSYLGTKIGQKVEFRFIYPSP